MKLSDDRIDELVGAGLSVRQISDTLRAEGYGRGCGKSAIAERLRKRGVVTNPRPSFNVRKPHTGPYACLRCGELGHRAKTCNSAPAPVLTDNEWTLLFGLRAVAAWKRVDLPRGDGDLLALFAAQMRGT